MVTLPNAAERLLSIVISSEDVDREVLGHRFPAAVITVIIGTEMFLYYSITRLMNLTSCCCIIIYIYIYNQPLPGFKDNSC